MIDNTRSLKILVIQQKMIGDVLASSILFEAIKSHYPSSELHYVINSHTFPVVQNNPFIDKFHFVTPEIESDRRAFYRFLKSIKRENYGYVIDVYSKLSSNLMTLFSSARVKISKYKWYTSFIYTHTFRDKQKSGTNAGLAVENRLRLLEPINFELSQKIIKPKIYISEPEAATARERLLNAGVDLKKPLCMISVLGSDRSKTYPYMAELLDALVAKTHSQILFNYIPNQQHEAIAVFEACQPITQSYIHFDVFEKGLREFLAVTSHCDALIGNEGGAVNMAKALNIPTFTIFSPWIKKEAWSMFDNGTTNISVHLKDFHPELFEGKSKQEIKARAFELYQKFYFDLFEEKLDVFLNNGFSSGTKSFD